MSLIGMLRDLTLFNLVKLQCVSRRHAQVSLLRSGREGRLVFVEGELIFASLGDLTGEEAVHELLRWDDGEFRVDHDPVSVPRNVHAPWLALFSDGIRRVDEARAERNAHLQACLQGVMGTQGLRAAVIVSHSGESWAAAPDGPAVAEGALAAFLAGRVEAIGRILDCGRPSEVLFLGPAETVWIVKRDGSTLACWLEGRAALSPLKALLQPLLGCEQAVGQGE